MVGNDVRRINKAETTSVAYLTRYRLSLFALRLSYPEKRYIAFGENQRTCEHFLNYQHLIRCIINLQPFTVLSAQWIYPQR